MKTALIYSDKLKKYDFGAGHPFRSGRFESFFKLYEEKLGKNRNFELIKNEKAATDEELELWHSKDYIKAIKSLSAGLTVPALYRYISQDNVNPITGKFPEGIEEAARTIVRNSILCFDYVQQGKDRKAVSIGGGLHHAKANYGEGFCIYNDVVVSVKYAIEKYNLNRVLVVDTDAHAGNGTSEAFCCSPKVLFIDLHQKGIYPGTGFIDEIGSGEGKGFNVNFPLAAGTSDMAYELIFDEVILPLVEAYRPEIIVRYGGSDPYPGDNITELGLTLDGFKMVARKVREMSAICDGKSVDMICSGYKPAALSKVWLTLIASLSGVEINLEDEISVDRYEMLGETRNLIKRVKENLKPYWKIFN